MSLAPKQDEKMEIRSSKDSEFARSMGLTKKYYCNGIYISRLFYVLGLEIYPPYGGFKIYGSYEEVAPPKNMVQDN